jgi:hypothetical protein
MRCKSRMSNTPTNARRNARLGMLFATIMRCKSEKWQNAKTCEASSQCKENKSQHANKHKLSCNT